MPLDLNCLLADLHDARHLFVVVELAEDGAVCDGSLAHAFVAHEDDLVVKVRLLLLQEIICRFHHF